MVQPSRASNLRSLFHGLGLGAMILLVANIGALVDCIFHPEIPYFDEEHILTGSITAVVCGVLFLLLISYVRRYGRAREVIQRLEAHVPICANCKKVRREGADPARSESWQSLESFLHEHTGSSLSHGLCPDCVTSLYPEYAPVFRQDA